MATDDIYPEKKRSKQVKTCYLKASRSQHNSEASCVQMYHSLHLACLCIHTHKKMVCVLGNKLCFHLPRMWNGTVAFLGCKSKDIRC